jgi:hypothetical protein
MTFVDPDLGSDFGRKAGVAKPFSPLPYFAFAYLVK